jgi:hypothetical protein
MLVCSPLLAGDRVSLMAAGWRTMLLLGGCQRPVSPSCRDGVIAASMVCVCSWTALKAGCPPASRPPRRPRRRRARSPPGRRCHRRRRRPAAARRPRGRAPWHIIGVDIIRCDDAGQMRGVRAMVRPLGPGPRGGRRGARSARPALAPPARPGPHPDDVGPAGRARRAAAAAARRAAVGPRGAARLPVGRLVDVPAALAARRYCTDLEGVLEVDDAFCPGNAGRWHVTRDRTGATCSATPRPADLVLSAADLGVGVPRRHAAVGAGRRRSRGGAHPGQSSWPRPPSGR